ncbi:hypothetical protein GL2_03330 [Microbulbifer sp. GL-2]|nr:hypothetical protein GL2_03330 [Microbulbifer sp. GL-2]
MRIIVLLLIFSSCAFADSFTVKKNEKPIEKYEKLCLMQHPPTHKAMFYKSELCKFGKEGCSGVSSKEPFEVLCNLEWVSKCYSMSAWQSRNQYFKLSPSVEVANISQRVTFSNGAKVTTICAHYK